MKVGFIDYFLDEAHASCIPEYFEKLSGGEVKVAYAYAKIDAPNGRTTDQWCADYGVQRCDSIEEVVRLSDALMVLAPDYPETHMELCELPLASGKPCYVDKTFAPDRATAEKIFKYADEHNTPVFSASGLRFSPALDEIDTSDIRGVSSWGPAWGGGIGYQIYAIHQIEPVMRLMNAKATKVMIETSAEKWYTMLIKFEDGRFATVQGFVEGFSPFMVNVATGTGTQTVNYGKSYNDNYYTQMIDFLRTGDVKVPHQDTIEIIAVLTAGLEALKKPGEWVEVAQ